VGIWFLFVCLIPILCTSCVMSKKPCADRVAVIAEDVVELSSKKRVFDVREAEYQEAALIDVPIPLYTQRLPVVTNDQHGSQVVLGYYSLIEPTSLVTLYQDQMERQGWNLVRSFVGTEALLHFEKPTRACSVSIRPHATLFGKAAGTDLVIYLEDSTFSW
jgi:hypothetical protein